MIPAARSIASASSRACRSGLWPVSSLMQSSSAKLCAIGRLKPPSNSRMAALSSKRAIRSAARSSSSKTSRTSRFLPGPTVDFIGSSTLPDFSEMNGFARALSLIARDASFGRASSASNFRPSSKTMEVLEVLEECAKSISCVFHGSGSSGSFGRDISRARASMSARTRARRSVSVTSAPPGTI